MMPHNSNPKYNEENNRISEDDQKKRGVYRLKEYGMYLTRYLREFCEMSSIQGLSYIVKDISLFERLWWLLVLMLSLSGSIYMIREIFDKLKTSPVLVSLATNEMSISEIPFPAVTICPETKISRRCLNYSEILKKRRAGNILKTDMKQSLKFDYMSLLCKSANHKVTLSSDGSDSYQENSEWVLDDYSGFLSDCSAIDLKKSECQWMNKKVRCEKVMAPIITDEGLCYSFNIYDVRDIYTDYNAMKYFKEGKRQVDWTPYDGYRKHIDVEELYPRRAFLNGVQNSFTAVFYSDKSDVNYACREFSTQGIRVSLHTAIDIPRLSQVFFSVGLDKLSTVMVTPSLTRTSKKVKHYNPMKRNCYLKNERKLKFFRYYSQSSCHLECWTNYTESFCGCVNFYMPRDNQTRVCNLKTHSCLQDAELNFTQDIWEERVKLANSKHRRGKTTVCNCLPLCSALNYFAEFSTSDWDFKNPDNAYFDGNRDNFSDLHASAVTIFFKQSHFLPYEREELFGFTDMVSNIGGALGLIIGFSLVSLGEIIYFLSIRLIENYRKHGSCWGPILNSSNPVE
ncbi:hypothetical protein HHI36_015353 [Cryptolaemus montrouzieri]|uniref:Uncharacterized protein n=1 Tax=Cryptolaemus montrouzieri TaxID=559131 RepID=A0ABD2N5C8_9CUCU